MVNASVVQTNLHQYSVLVDLHPGGHLPTGQHICMSHPNVLNITRANLSHCLTEADIATEYLRNTLTKTIIKSEDSIRT